jgi:hypothetical protein
MYLEVAELAGLEEAAEARNVAAGNGVLAGIAASDALCCARLGRRHRGQDHQGAIELLGRIRPDGAALARALATVLAIKDPAHYGHEFISDPRLKATLRTATQLVEAAENVLSGG